MSNHVKYDFKRHTKVETDAHKDALDIVFPTDVTIDIAERLQYNLNHGKVRETELTEQEIFNVRHIKQYKEHDRQEDRKDIVKHSTPYAIQNDGRIRSLYYDEENDDFYRIVTPKNGKGKTIISAFKQTNYQMIELLYDLAQKPYYIVDYKNYIVYSKLDNKQYNLRKTVDPFAKQ